MQVPVKCYLLGEGARIIIFSGRRNPYQEACRESLRGAQIYVAENLKSSKTPEQLYFLVGYQWVFVYT